MSNFVYVLVEDYEITGEDYRDILGVFSTAEKAIDFIQNEFPEDTHDRKNFRWVRDSGLEFEVSIYDKPADIHSDLVCYCEVVDEHEYS